MDNRNEVINKEAPATLSYKHTWWKYRRPLLYYVLQSMNPAQRAVTLLIL